MKPLIDGLLTGMFLQLAMGPVFFYVFGITLDSTYASSLAAILAVTLADYAFIVLSLIGLGRLLSQDRPGRIFGITGPVVLVLFGMMMFYKGLILTNGSDQVTTAAWTPLKSFISCFVLTASSPLTIVFWGSIFSAKVIEKNYVKKQLAVFGAGAGASTFLFLSVSMLILSYLKTGIPGQIIQFLNCSVGVILICYGLTRSYRAVSAYKRPGAGKISTDRS